MLAAIIHKIHVSFVGPIVILALYFFFFLIFFLHLDASARGRPPYGSALPLAQPLDLAHCCPYAGLRPARAPVAPGTAACSRGRGCRRGLSRTPHATACPPHAAPPQHLWALLLLLLAGCDNAASSSPVASCRRSPLPPSPVPRRCWPHPPVTRRRSTSPAAHRPLPAAPCCLLPCPLTVPPCIGYWCQLSTPLLQLTAVQLRAALARLAGSTCAARAYASAHAKLM
jgi:hypothetical protein